MPTVKNIYPAVSAPIGDLVTYRALPTSYIDYIDPFLFLNHHGPQVYSPYNDGLPFGPHPHRGMETVTFIIAGDIAHQDSSGHQSVIEAGGVQWMTAGSGLIHSEVSSADFMEKGGPMEILQLWVNLPASLKMTAPFYKGLQKQDIPALTLDDGKVTLNLVSGEWLGHQGAFKPQTPIALSTIAFKAGARLKLIIPQQHHIFFYVISGQLDANGTTVNALHLADFNQDDEGLSITATADSLLLLGHALPFNEPVVAEGPFVMNTHEEIAQAYEDYRRGLFGTWKG